MNKMMVFRTDIRRAQKKGYIKQDGVNDKDEKNSKDTYDYSYLNTIHLTEEDWNWLNDIINRLDD